MARIFLAHIPWADADTCDYCGECLPSGFKLGGFIKVEAEDKSRPDPRFYHRHCAALILMAAHKKDRSFCPVCRLYADSNEMVANGMGGHLCRHCFNLIN